MTLTISASVVAWYGAILSSIAICLQIANFLRDRKAALISIQRKMKMYGDPRYTGTYTVVSIVNIGRRPFTLSNVGLVNLAGGGAIFTDVRPPLPCQLSEGQRAQAIVDETGVNFDEIRSFEAYDAGGGTYYYYTAPWHRRALWFFKRHSQPPEDKSP